MPLANIIFPAPSAVYITTFFIPLATILALVTECIIFVRMQRGVVSAGKLSAVVVVLNVFSWLVGWFLSELLPTGLVPQLKPNGVSIIEPGPQWNLLALLSFPFACLVSMLLEYFGLRALLRWLPLHRPLRTVAVANVASYLVLGGTVFLSLHFGWV